jgi:hypothetical protein
MYYYHYSRKNNKYALLYTATDQSTLAAPAAEQQQRTNPRYPILQVTNQDSQFHLFDPAKKRKRDITAGYQQRKPPH